MLNDKTNSQVDGLPKEQTLIPCFEFSAQNNETQNENTCLKNEVFLPLTNDESGEIRGEYSHKCLCFSNRTKKSA